MFAAAVGTGEEPEVDGLLPVVVDCDVEALVVVWQSTDWDGHQVSVVGAGTGVPKLVPSGMLMMPVSVVGGVGAPMFVPSGILTMPDGTPVELASGILGKFETVVLGVHISVARVKG